MRHFFIFAVSLLLLACGPSSTSNESTTSEAPPYVVFITGDEEYRSEESMPMLARLAERELGVRTKVLFALDSTGRVNPNVNDNIPGLAALDSADLAVFFLRWRALPQDQLNHILAYAESGKPMVGFRTSTHTFKYDDPVLEHLTNDWPTAVFGQQWIVHHGHFDDGEAPLTRVEVLENQADHPILRGVTGFLAYSWLYHVDGGEWSINPNADVLLEGTSLRSKHERGGRLDEFPLTNPVAWTNEYKGAPVFFTTLGHPYDWRDENMRRLALNGMAWALGHSVPAPGWNVDFVGQYSPNNSGFGDRFKGGLSPGEF